MNSALYKYWINLKKNRLINEEYNIMDNLIFYGKPQIGNLFLGKKIFIVSKQKNRQKIQKIDIYNIHKLHTKKKK